MSPTALWFLTRGTGAVTLLLLTVSVALGVANVRRARTVAIPRFVFEAVHRNVALLAVVFLLIHISTSLLDGYAPIRLLDVVVPFGAAYRPVWLGFGAVAFDLIIAVVLTSLVRRRLGYGAWRATHWAAYASWPVAVLHGLGTGSDARTSWMLMLTAGCVIIVIVAVAVRATAGWPEHSGTRLAAIGAAVMLPLGLLIWLPSGPLSAGWARRAGTPPSLLRAASVTPAPGPSTLAHFSGSATKRELAPGREEVGIALRASGPRLDRIQIRIDGQPIDGGGVELSSSTVTLGTPSDPARYRGHVLALNGSHIVARVRDSHGTSFGISARIAIDSAAGTAAGMVRLIPESR